jgi:ketosteroid isomerase-like protein
MALRGGFRALALGLVAACAHAPDPAPGADPAAEILRLDAAWARTLADGDAEGFRARVAPDALFAGRALLRGRDEVWAGWKVFFAEGGPSLRWTPTSAGVAGSGELGWTTGRFRFSSRDAAGRAVERAGEYLTVWTLGADGSWRVALDCGLEPAAGVGPAERTAVRSLASRDGTLEAAMGTWAQDGAGGGRRGAWITVRERAGETWTTRFESAVAFPPPP